MNPGGPLVWQLLALLVAAALVVAGVALIYVPAGVIVAGALVGAAALLVDPDAFRKGGKP